MKKNFVILLSGLFFALSPSFMNAAPSRFMRFFVEPISTTVCESLFGAIPADPILVAQMQEARKDHGIINSKLPVNYIAPSCPFLNRHFLSFTWFGTWFNKHGIQRVSNEQKTFQIYHEAAHEKAYHPIKQIGVFVTTLISGLLANKYAVKPLLDDLMTSTTLLPWAQNSIRAGAYVGTIALLLRLVVPWYARHCERQADIAAVQTLNNTGKQETVRAYIDELQEIAQEKSHNSSLFFDTLSARIASLKAAASKVR